MKTKIIQITGKGNFSLSNTGVIKNIPLCDSQVKGNHNFIERKKEWDPYKTEEISLNRNQVLIKEYYKGSIYCEFCKIVLENKNIVEESKRWIGSPTKVIDNRGFLSKIFEIFEGQVYSIDPETGVKTIEEPSF